MNLEARKFKLISQIMRITDDATLKTLEATMEQLLPEEASMEVFTEHTMAEYGGIFNPESAKALMEYVTQSQTE